MIELRNINKYYKSGQEKFHALKNINIKFPEKGIVFITGKSGSGKSTLLNIIGGIDSYDDGDLLINNVSTKNFSKKDYNSYRNTYIGFIFQEFNVIKSLTVYENIALSIQLHNESVKQHHDEIMEVIEKVGLKGKEKRKMNQLSGGERQRVAIARSLIKNPQVIIADEPTGNLDKKNRDTVMDILKSLANERLVLVVTHDRHLASLYGEVEISLKDGEIIENKIIEDSSSSDTLDLKPISPNLLTSLSLGLKSFKLNLLRYILIILLFATSLIFAGSVINLFLVNTTKEYAEFQKTYNNFVIDLNKQYTEDNITVQTGFNTIEYDDYVALYTKNNQMTSYKSTIFNYEITNNDNLDSSFYQKTIERINLYNSNTLKSFNYVDSCYDNKIMNNNYACLITDYVADALLYYNYFGSSITTQKQLLGKTITHPYFKNNLIIGGIIKTKGYSNFKKQYQNDVNEFIKNKNVSIAFYDNLAFYNAIYVDENSYYSSNNTSLLSSSNINYVDENIFYTAFGKSGYAEGIKVTVFKSTLKYDGQEPVKPEKGYPTQLAVSKGLLQEVFGYVGENYVFDEKEKLQPGLLNNEGNRANFKINGVMRSPSSYNFIITAVIDTDEKVLYLPEYTFPAYLKFSFNEGGYLVMTINSDSNVNANIYRDMLDNNITINNLSFKKLQLVDNFINDNLLLFAGLFFVFCLFSILMIFNFIIINIKNSTRDIGIYSSLGMNGFKISMIYFFQVLIVSIISLIIGLIGSAIFLIILDSVFSSKSPIDFRILKYTILGVITMTLLAFLTPMLAVIIPLYNLGKKKPIDVIKSA